MDPLSYLRPAYAISVEILFEVHIAMNAACRAVVVRWIVAPISRWHCVQAVEETTDARPSFS
jgi:hypothetical protein